MQSKAYWGYSKEFMAACSAELTVSPDDLSNPEVDYFVCEVSNSIIGYCAIEISDQECELEALFVAPEHIGHGHGRMLMNHAKWVARQSGAKSMLIQGDPNAEKCYLAAGATKIGERESASVPGRFLPEFRIHLVVDHSA